MDKTTIQISTRTLERLKSLKRMDRQSYDDLLNSLIDTQDDDHLSDEELREIQQGLEDIKRGKLYPIEQIAAELGIKLE